MSDQVERQITSLDEPVWATIAKDLKKILLKLRHVLVPSGSGSSEHLQDWELFGPLLITMFLAIMLSMMGNGSDSDGAFSLVFLIVWGGAVLVHANVVLLGGDGSIFQSICLLGYCIFPITIGGLLCQFVKSFIFITVVMMVCLSWSVYASVDFLTALVPKGRRVLAVYPIYLFFFALSFFLWIQLIPRGS
ncbi:hypothetical protein PCE1_004898 [Barthelona sp. PCE]